MSEFSTMADKLHISLPLAYAVFVIGSALIGWGTYVALMHAEARRPRRAAEGGGEALPAP
jgi:hypothetical protein